MATIDVSVGQGFDETYYLAAKAAQLTATTGQSWNVAQTLAAIQAAGLTPEEHYSMYGYNEGLAPNAYYNDAQYVASKAAAAGITPDQLRLDWYNASGSDNMYTHYMLYGAFEDNVNPSTGFNDADYYAAKAAQMGGGATPEDAENAIKAAGMNAVSHYLLYGKNESLAFTPTPTPINGQTFSLTVNQDFVDSSYTTVSGLIGTTLATSTLQVNDVINTNNARLDLILDAGSDLTAGTAPNLDGISSLNVLPTADNSSVDMARLTNVTTVTTDGSSLAAGEEITFNNVDASKVAWTFGGFASAGSADINITSGDTGSADAVNLTFTGTTGTGGEDIILTGSKALASGGGAETLNLVTKTAATRMDSIQSEDSTGATVLKTVAITGDENLRIDDANGLNIVSGGSVDASGMTGTASVNLGITAAGAITVTGTANDDRVIMDTITNTKTIDLGTGTNTVGISGAAVAAGGMDNVSNYQTFELAGTSTATQDADNLASGINYLISSTGASASFIDLADSSNVQITANTAGTTTVELKANTADDTLNLTLGSLDGAQAINQLDVDANTTNTVENVNVSFQGSSDFTLTTNNVDSNNVKVTGTGTGAFDWSEMETAGKFDASALTGTVTVEAAAAATTTSIIKTGSGNDAITLQGGAGGDVSVNSGDGNDTLTIAAAQEHTITTGAGTDSIQFDDLATAVATGTAISAMTEFATITDFESGSDTLALSDGVFGFGTSGTLDSAQYVEGTLVTDAALDTDVEAIATAGGLAAATTYIADIQIGSSVYTFYDANGAGNAGGVSLISIASDTTLADFSNTSFTLKA